MQSNFNAQTLPPPWNVIFPLAARVLVWSLLFATLYLLRSFFLLIFLTFVFAYLQNHFVVLLARYIRLRWLRVTIVGLCLLTIVVGVMTYLFPEVKNQAEIFAGRHSHYLRTLDSQIVKYSQKYPTLTYLSPQIESIEPEFDEQGLLVNWELQQSISTKLLQLLVGITNSEKADNAAELVHGVRSVFTNLLATGSSFLLSLLFSFLIVLDLNRLTASVRDLSNTRVAFIYNEVASTIRNFSAVVGSALIAQLFIAILNTVLTGIGIHILGLQQHLAFFSIIVFLCSFIPVAGVFISSAPICLLALEQGGINLVLFSIILIWVIHLVEAYILNPHIYGNKLRVNPVLVLIILTGAGKLFGIWGLVLGLPVCTYIFGHAIRYNSTSPAYADH